MLASGSTSSFPPSLLSKSSNPINIGILGAANITPMALINPAKTIPNVVVYAIAARNKDKAENFAKQHGIPVVHATYEDLINDPKVHAVFIPLPNSHHAKFTSLCIAANKHVICEKPFSANEREAQSILSQLEALPDSTRPHVIEAFHYRTHPFIRTASSLFQSATNPAEPKLSYFPYKFKIKHATVNFMIPFNVFSKNDIRYNPDLAGGCTMDGGCYAINVARKLIFNEEPVSVISAKPTLHSPDIDSVMKFRLLFSNDRTCDITVSFIGPFVESLSNSVTNLVVNAVSDESVDQLPDLEIRFSNFIAPSVWCKMSVKHLRSGKVDTINLTNAAGDILKIQGSDGFAHNEMVTYWHQLSLFSKLVNKTITDEEKQALTFTNDAVKNMKVIDSVYEKAGMKLRNGSKAFIRYTENFIAKNSGKEWNFIKSEEEDTLLSPVQVGSLAIVKRLCDLVAYVHINKDIDYDLIWFFISNLEKYRSPLYLACANRHLEIVVYLVEQQGAVIELDYNSSFLKTVSKLPNLENKKQFSLPEYMKSRDFSYSLLFPSVYFGHEAIVSYLLSCGLDPSVLHLTYSKFRSWTATVFAAKRNHVGIMKILIDNGATFRVDSNVLPLDEMYHAASCRSLDILKYFLQNRIPDRNTSTRLRIQYIDYYGEIVRAAVLKNHVDAVVILLDAMPNYKITARLPASAAVTSPTNIVRWRHLESADSHKKIILTEIFLETISIQPSNYFVKNLKTLMVWGANLQGDVSEVASPPHCAAQYSPEVFKLFVQFKGNITLFSGWENFLLCGGT
ncbi:hypothetical protein HK098_006583, partial [Nowakowskiella sp. JEL0407]